MISLWRLTLAWLQLLADLWLKCLYLLDRLSLVWFQQPYRCQSQTSELQRHHMQDTLVLLTEHWLHIQDSLLAYFIGRSITAREVELPEFDMLMQFAFPMWSLTPDYCSPAVTTTPRLQRLLQQSAGSQSASGSEETGPEGAGFSSALPRVSFQPQAGPLELLGHSSKPSGQIPAAPKRDPEAHPERPSRYPDSGRSRKW